LPEVWKMVQAQVKECRDRAEAAKKACQVRAPR
jgi:hypothetical protein